MILESEKGLFPFFKDYIVGFHPGVVGVGVPPMPHGGVLKKPFRIVQYAFKIADLQEEVYARTSRVARHTPAKGGESQFDKGTLSVDEEEEFEELCRKAADEAARVMMPFLPLTQRAYIYNKGYVTTGDVAAGEYAKSGTDLYMARVDSNVTDIATDDFEKLDGDVSLSVHFICKKAVDVFDNSVMLTEESLREMLIMYIMKEWFAEVLPERWEQYEGKYERARENLRFNLNMMDRPVRGGHPF